MLKHGFYEKYGKKIFFCAFLMSEMKKGPFKSKYGAYLDTLPKDYNNFPVFFCDEDLLWL